MHGQDHAVDSLNAIPQSLGSIMNRAFESSPAARSVQPTHRTVRDVAFRDVHAGPSDARPFPSVPRRRTEQEHDLQVR